MTMQDEDMRFLEGDREAVAAYGLPKRQEELLLALMAEERKGVKNCDVVIRKFGNKYMERVGIYDVMNCARYGRALPVINNDFADAKQHESEKLGVNVNDPSLAVRFDDIYAVTRPSGRCVYVNHDAGKAAEKTNEIDIIKDSLEHADKMNLPENTRRQYEAILTERQIKEANHTYAEALNITDNAKRMCETLRNEIQLNHAKNCDLVIRKWGETFQMRLNIDKFLPRAIHGQDLTELINDERFSQARMQAVERLGGWEYFDDPSLKVTLGDVYAITMPRGGRCVYVNDDAGKSAEETRSVPAAETEPSNKPAEMGAKPEHKKKHRGRGM